MIELGKVESPMTEIVHEAFEAAATATLLKIGEVRVIWRSGLSSRTRFASDGDRDLQSPSLHCKVVPKPRKSGDSRRQ
ncbi:hypothetical protein TIFTF001_010657 [Ficus carica]|uniref:Uncharacterized protein n=1 Tax=Ficus carica TaxID=3494 RepID=A0AA87ZS40_FICCA|nr:hypothetical protein TIFTF001_010657 [Ficus carica]